MCMDGTDSCLFDMATMPSCTRSEKFRVLISDEVVRAMDWRLSPSCRSTHAWVTVVWTFAVTDRCMAA
jgi:hypothetical protein